MKFTINGQIVDNKESTKITIPKKKIISCNDWFYNKNNNSDVHTFCPEYFTLDYIWNYFEIKIDFSKFPYKTAYLIFYPYYSTSNDYSNIPFLKTPISYDILNEFDMSTDSNFTEIYDRTYFTLLNFFKNIYPDLYSTTILEISAQTNSFDLMIHRPHFSGQIKNNNDDYFWTGSIPKVPNQGDILTLGIGSKANKPTGTNNYKGFDPKDLKVIDTQFIFLNTEDDNLDHGFKIADILSTTQYFGVTDSSDLNHLDIKNSHDYAWKFGIVNYTNNDIDLNIASYKKDITSMGEKLAQEVNGSLDGEAIEEIKPVEYEIKQILPTTRDIVTGNSFKYNGMNIKLSGNGEDFYYYYALIENNDESDFFMWARNIETGVYLPSIFEIDFGKEIDNICQISFSPMVTIQNNNSSCSVKNYSLYISTNHDNWSLIKESIFDNTTHKLYFKGLLFSPEDIIIENPIPIRYIKIIISSIYPESHSYNRSGFGHFRIYTNTKNLYNKELYQSISNYKDNSFNQVTTKPEWDQKSKEDKIILNKQASFDNPSISKIKNELNDFRIITNHNNISIYEKT